MMTRQILIDEILEKLRSDSHKKWSLGSSWLERMTDKELKAKHAEVIVKLVCEDCGSLKNVTKGICPYDDDIHNKKTEVILCEKCYHDRAQDI